MLSNQSIEFVFFDTELKEQLISHVCLHHHDVGLLMYLLFIRIIMNLLSLFHPMHGLYFDVLGVFKHLYDIFLGEFAEHYLSVMCGLLSFNLLHLLLHLKLIEHLLVVTIHQVVLLAVLEHLLGHVQLSIHYLRDLIVSIVFLFVLIFYQLPIIFHLIILEILPSPLSILSCM